MQTFDLQIQSSASDGAYPPRELVRRAADLGITTIAITDHDTVSGVSEALLAGADYGVAVFPGIELTVAEGKVPMHLLGFGIDDRHPPFLEALVVIQRERVERAKEIVRRLQAAGFRITYEDVLRFARGSSVARPHIAQALLANPENKKILGEDADVDRVIRGYLVPGKPAYVEHAHISMRAGIEMIHAASGVAVWSHPALNIPSPAELEALVQKFAGYGIDGIEVFNPAESEQEVRLLYRLAEKYSLLATGGSDFHTDQGENARRDGGRALASFLTYGLDTSGIVSKLEEAIARRRGKM